MPPTKMDGQADVAEVPQRSSYRAKGKRKEFVGGAIYMPASGDPNPTFAQ